VAVQFGSEVLIWAAIFDAIWALLRPSSTQEYVVAPMVTEWEKAMFPCHYIAWSQEVIIDGTV